MKGDDVNDGGVDDVKDGGGGGGGVRGGNGDKQR